MKKFDKWLLRLFGLVVAIYFASYYFVAIPSLLFNWPVILGEKWNTRGTTNPIVKVLDQQENEGIVVEGPTKLGGGVCVIGVVFGELRDRRSVLAVFIPENRQIVLGQKVKVRVNLISETYHESFFVRVSQEEMSKSKP